MTNIEMLAKAAKEAAKVVGNLSTSQKNRMLKEMVVLLHKETGAILKANQIDILKGRGKHLAQALLDRLLLNPKRIKEMADGLRAIIQLPDPVGKITESWRRPNGLKVKKVRISLGVIGMIFEARPNVIVDAAALCIKSGNAVILRGGSEAFHSNQILTKLWQRALKKCQLPAAMVQSIPTTDHKAVQALLTMDKYIDLIIPRGGAGLMQMVREHSKIPVLRHDKGVCHVYVDDKADFTMAQKIVLNAKVQRPGVCNAMETLLVAKPIAKKFLPSIIAELQKRGVEIRGCPETRKMIPQVKAATEKDWETEYLDLILAVRVVPNMDTAIDHIAHYGSLHTETIVTKNKKSAQEFLKQVTASVVLHNASTRFNDGFQLGLGAEMGISTTKLHAFGPMGLEALTTTKFVVEGTGQIRS